ncbi:hypothetical protein FRC03_007739 [Tulasnella sp. 419]|nr:hypothetical protein FRC03_007739 [Tulasnella sp. 419]
MISINCLIHTAPSDHSFRIDANDEWGVIDLKREICKEVKKDWAPNEITLWQVSIHDDENIGNTLKELKLEQSGKVMKGTWLLRDYYQSSPALKYIHVIVVPPKAAGE